MSDDARPTDRPDFSALIPVAQIRPCPTNPRRLYRGLEELAASIKERGILQHLLVRLISETPLVVEIVDGERRYRAAKMLGLDVLPCSLRIMTDLEVLESQLAASLERADLEPLEEAEAFERLQAEYGLNVEEIAGKFNRSRSYVQGRMRLLKLCEEGRDALTSGTVTPAVALLVARLESTDLQITALDDVTIPNPEGGRTCRPLWEARKTILAKYMLRLKDAPFPIVDDTLDGGACGPCLKRTGSSPDLFGDVEDADTCTDRRCFDRKVVQHGDRTEAAHVAKGGLVLTDTQRRQVFGTSEWVASACGFVDVDSPYGVPWEISRDKRGAVTWRKLLKKRLPDLLVGRSQSGRLYWLARSDEIQAAAIGAGLADAPSAPGEPKASTTPAERKAAREHLKRAEALRIRKNRETYRALFARAHELGVQKVIGFVLPRIVDAMTEAAWRKLEGVLGEEGGEHLGPARANELCDADFDTQGALLLSLVVASDSAGDALDDATEVFGVDADAIGEQVAADIEAEEEAAAAAKRSKRKRKATSDGGETSTEGATDGDA